MPVPAACRPLKSQLDAATKALQHIQSMPGYIQGSDGPHPGKPDPELLREALAEEAKIRTLTGEFNACLKKHGIEPTEILHFGGVAKLSSTLGSGHHTFSFPLEFFTPHHKTLTVFDFPAIHVDVAGHTVTVTQTGGGAGHFDPANGHLDLQIDLRVDAPWPGGHMDMAVTLSTENPHGSRMDEHGQLTIIGSSTAHGSGAGFPDKVDVTVTASGNVHPHP